MSKLHNWQTVELVDGDGDTIPHGHDETRVRYLRQYRTTGGMHSVFFAAPLPGQDQSTEEQWTWGPTVDGIDWSGFPETVQMIDAGKWAQGLVEYCGDGEDLDEWLDSIDTFDATFVTDGLVGWGEYTHVLKLAPHDTDVPDLYYAVTADVARRFKVKCGRCGRPYREREQGEWNTVLEDDRVVSLVCPDCQTPEENVEAVINEATLGVMRSTEREILCVVCQRATDTALGFTGEAEWIIAALVTLGVPKDRAYLKLESEPGMVPPGEVVLAFAVCGECVAKCNARLKPGASGLKVGPVDSPEGVPGYRQRADEKPWPRKRPA